MSENLKLAGLSRVNVLGVGVHAIDMRQALAVFRRTLEDRRKGYVCVTGVHGIMEAQKYPEFKAILNGSLLTTPDGVPTGVVSREPFRMALNSGYFCASMIPCTPVTQT